MPVTVAPANKGESGSHGRASAAEDRYRLSGTYDRAEAIAALIAAAPLAVDVSGTGINFIPRDSHSVHHLGGGIWDASVRYGSPAGVTEPEAGKCELSGDTGGGTVHVTQAISSTHYVNPNNPDPPADPEGAIGMTADGVAGTDIEDRAFKFTARVIRALDETYLGIVSELTATVNSAAWTVYDEKRGLRLSFLAGQVKYLGMTWTPRDDGTFDCRHSFDAGPNQVGVDIAPGEGITPFDRKAWELAEVHYFKTTRDNRLGMWPDGVAIHQVYYMTDFSLLELPP